MHRRALATALLVTLVAACSGGQEPTGEQVEKEARATMERMRKGEKVTETDSGLNPCAILESGIVSEVFGVEASAIEYRPSSVMHPLCMASWRKPNAEELEKAYNDAVMDWTRRKVAAMSQREAFDEKMPSAERPNVEASLTIYNQTYDSPSAAAEALEGIVATMKKGVTVTVRGKEHTSRVDYGDWIDGVGDRAAWAPKLSQLSVAAEGVIYHVAVHLADADENQAKAIELARAIAEKL